MNRWSAKPSRIACALVLLVAVFGVSLRAAGTVHAASEPAAENLPETAALGGRLSLNNDAPAELAGASLAGSPLVAATFWGADLRGADLRNAALQGADLRNADLRGAWLDGAQLQGARLRGAKLRGASLRGAKLARVDLSGADLTLADLRGADFFIEPDWDALIQAVDSRVPPRLDRDRLLRSLRKMPTRALNLKGARLDRTLLDKPVCVFPPVSALDVFHGYDTSKGKPLTASSDGAAPKKWIDEHTTLLGKLACGERAGRVARAFVEGLTADRRGLAKETGIDVPTLIGALLKRDCAGGMALPAEVRDELMQKESGAYHWPLSPP